MPADRLLHPRAGHSRKVSLLTDLEFRVWAQYLLSADDFGVMRATPSKLKADNAHLEHRPVKVLQRCLDALVTGGLCGTFDHQGSSFLYSHNWQTYQKVEYPRATDNPPVPTGALETCDEPTRALFMKHPGGQRKDRRRAEDAPNDSGRASQTHPEGIPPTRAGARAERLTANANGSRLVADGEPLDVAFRTFQAAYPEHRRQGGHLVEVSFVDQAFKAGGAAALMAALENHRASQQWADLSLVPQMSKWLAGEYWRQTLPAKGSTPPAPRATKSDPQWAIDARALRDGKAAHS